MLVVTKKAITLQRVIAFFVLYFEARKLNNLKLWLPPEPPNLLNTNSKLCRYGVSDLTVLLNKSI
jgi:hypothetical protein